MEGTKKPWESKSIVLNTIMGVLSGLAWGFPHANVIVGWLNQHMVEIGMAWSVLAIVFRWVSKDKVQLGD